MFWDNLQTTNTVSYLDSNIFINELDDDYNIFDMNKIRKINISNILQVENTTDLEALIIKMKKHESILINIDYIPSNNNKILNKLYYKRINQIYNYFSNRLKNTKVYLSSNYKFYLENQDAWYWNHASFICPYISNFIFLNLSIKNLTPFLKLEIILSSKSSNRITHGTIIIGV